MGCNNTKIIQVLSAGGGGPYTVTPNTPAPGQVTILDTLSSESFVITLNDATQISDVDGDTQVVTVESGAINGGAGDRLDFIVDGVTVGSAEILVGNTVKWTLNGIVDPTVFAATGLTEIQRDAVEDLTAGYLVYNSDIDSFEQYNGATWDRYSIVKDINFADDTTVASAIAGTPTLTEMETFIAGESPAITDAYVYYTGTDTLTDIPTHTYAVDGSGNVLALTGFEATLEIRDNLTPSAQDTVPNLSSIPQDAAKVKFFIDHDFDYADMITSDAAGVLTVDGTIFATYAYNVETTNTVVAIYHKKP